MNSIIHFGLAERSLPGDITLADISMMAQAEGEINPDCPNGCLLEYCKKGCYCYGWHYFVKEKEWD